MRPGLNRPPGQKIEIKWRHGHPSPAGGGGEGVWNWCLVPHPGRLSDPNALNWFTHPPLDARFTPTSKPAARYSLDMSSPGSIGPYVIERELGRGGMGVVYMARDPRLERTVAIKVLHPELLDNNDALLRFERETKALASLSHPNIGAILALEESEGRRCMILEFVEGPSLAERLNAGPLPIVDILEIARQVASAVEAAHERGIVHRDLKPANIHVRADGLVKVLDFGLAKTMPQRMSARSEDSTIVMPSGTVAGQLLGTPGYMSPEQARGQSVAKTTDVWALGCIAYECITGQLAFPGSSIADCVAAVLRSEPKWEAIPRHAPPRLVALIRACLEKEPEKRLPDMARVRTELERIQHDLGMAKTLIGGPGSTLIVTDAFTSNEPSFETNNATPGPRPSNLPPAPALIAREREVQEIHSLLNTEGVGIVTLIGALGSGKTSLAVKAAAELAWKFKDGAWMIQAPPGTSVLGLCSAALACLTGVTQSGERSLDACLAEGLSSRSVLLLIDDVDHVGAEAANLLDAVLRTSPRSKVIVTGLKPLGIHGERVMTVSPLAAPDPEDKAAAARPGAFEAARVFVARASQAQPTFKLTQATVGPVAKLCRRVEGNPLAVTFVASALDTLSLDQINRGLDLRLRMSLTGVRAQTTQVVGPIIDWSWDLLPETARVLLRRLAVFVGGWTLRSASAVCRAMIPQSQLHAPALGVTPGPATDLDVVALHQLLINRGLIAFESTLRPPAEEARFVLSRSVWDKARRQLDASGEIEALRSRHALFCLAACEDVEPRLGGAEADRLLDLLCSEHWNILHALAWCVTPTGDRDLGLHLASAVSRFWRIRGLFTLGRSWLEALLEGPTATTPARARALASLSRISRAMGDHANSVALQTQSESLFKELGIDSVTGRKPSTISRLLGGSL